MAEGDEARMSQGDYGPLTASITRKPAGSPSPRLLSVIGMGPPLYANSVNVASAGEVDAELVGWLRESYDSAG